MGIRHRAFQVPLFDQRGEFSDPVTLKAADNTEFTARPTYSYKVMKTGLLILYLITSILIRLTPHREKMALCNH